MDINLLNKFTSYATITVGNSDSKKSYEQEKRLQRFAEKFRFVKLDIGYFEFLRIYSGLHIYRQNPLFILDIFGFSNKVSELIEYQDSYYWEGEYNIWNDEGYLLFATLDFVKDNINHSEAEIVSQGFALKQVNEFEICIYQVILNSDGEIKEHNMYCKNFMAFLNMMLNLLSST
jgi:hypothetical protein